METSAIHRNDQVSSGTKAITDSGLNISSNWDYEAFFKTGEVKYHISSPYIIVAHEQPYYGWVLYLSVIRQQALSLFNLLIPKLQMMSVPFEIPESGATHASILDGGLGYERIGKVICIYPYNDENALFIANELIELTREFAGPEIPTAIHLRGIVYTGIIHGEGLNFNWPFISIAKPLYPKTKRWLKKYFIVQQLKGDAKGNVYKCLNVTKWTNIHWCVVKQGLAYQCADDHGRTVKDRLEWQYELLKDFEGKIPLPKALEYFEQQGDAYLVTEFVSGQNLYEKINALQAGVAWMGISLESKLRLVKILLAIIEIIDQFHACGLVHRDINPGNFLIRENGEIVAIDIELVYDDCSDMPDPAFSYGTPGYISPQQQQQQIPEIEDDIYGLGGLMIKIFTGISPTKFVDADSDMLFKNIVFLIGNHRVASMICSCLHSDRSMRPDIKSISHTLEVYDALILTGFAKTNFLADRKIHADINGIIQKAINAFTLPELCNAMGYWVSKSASSDNRIANEFRAYQCSTGFATGVSGIIYLLAEADRSGFDITGLHDLIYHNYEMLNANGEFVTGNNGDYFGGTAGIAVCINGMITSGLLENSVINNDLIYKALNRPVNGLCIATGLAGKGLAILNCQSNSKLPNLYAMVSAIVGTLIKEQKTDGSWDIKETENQKKGIKLYSFSYGISGIIYFFLAYYEKYGDTKVKSAIIKSLDWLKRQRKDFEGKLFWPVSSKINSVDPWFEFGFTGIALAYIKAYEVLKIPYYKDLAINTLHHHPENISSNYLMYSNGLSGLGEVYLFAYKIFEDDEWLKRAGHIVNMLSHLYRQPDDNSIYWLESNHSNPATDFMAGNAGIIHFLISYANPERMRMPL